MIPVTCQYHGYSLKNVDRVNYTWSVITHDRSKKKFLVINQFHIIDHVIKTHCFNYLCFYYVIDNMELVDDKKLVL